MKRIDLGDTKATDFIMAIDKYASSTIQPAGNPSGRRRAPLLSQQVRIERRMMLVTILVEAIEGDGGHLYW